MRHLARHQIAGLIGAFLLGMAVNLTGLPSQASGGVRIASVTSLAAHVLIALGLAVGAALLLRAAARVGGWRLRQAAGGAAAIAVTVAAGFISAFLVYGRLLLPEAHRAGRVTSAEEATARGAPVTWPL